MRAGCNNFGGGIDKTEGCWLKLEFTMDVLSHGCWAGLRWVHSGVLLCFSFMFHKRLAKEP